MSKNLNDPVSFFGNKNLTQIEADSEELKAIELYQRPDESFPSIQTARSAKSIAVNFLKSYDDWNRSKGNKERLPTYTEAARRVKAEKFNKNLKSLSGIFSSDDSKFRDAMQKRGVLENYESTLENFNFSEEELKNSYRKRFFLNDLVGDTSGLSEAKVSSHLFGELPKTTKDFVDKANLYIGDSILKNERMSTAHSRGVAAFIAGEINPYENEDKGINPYEAEAFSNGFNLYKSGQYAKMFSVANKMVAYAKREGEETLTDKLAEFFGFNPASPEQPVSEGTIARFYQIEGGRDAFLYALNALAEKEGAEIDSNTFSKLGKNVLRFYEGVVGNLGRGMLDRAIEEKDRALFYPNDPESKNYEIKQVETVDAAGLPYVETRRVAKKLSDDEKAFWKNVSQVATDFRDLKSAVAQINGDNWFETMIIDQGGTIAQLPMIATMGGALTLYQAQRQADKEDLLRDYPTLTEDEAQTLANTSAGLNIFAEKAQTAFFLKPLKKVNRLSETFKNLDNHLDRIKNLTKAANPLSVAQNMKAFGAAAGAQLTVEYLQETFQEASIPLTVDLYNFLDKELPEGNWDDFKTWDQRRFLATLPLSLLGAGGKVVRDGLTRADLRRVLKDEQMVKEFGRSAEQAKELAEIADTDPDKALKQFKEQEEAMPKEEREALGEEAFRERISEEYGQEFEGIPIMRQTEDGKVELRHQDGSVEVYESAEEGQAALDKWMMGSFLDTGDAVRAFSGFLQERVGVAEKLDIDVTQEDKTITLQDLLDRGQETEANLKKAVGIYYMQKGEQPPADPDINLANFEAPGFVTLKKQMAGFSINLSRGANPLVVGEEFAEGFYRSMVRFGETSRDEMKQLLDEFGELAGIDMTQGFDTDPDRAIVEGFSKFVKAYALQGRHDGLPKETQRWMERAWGILQNPNSVSQKLRSLAELFAKMWAEVFNVAKAIEKFRAAAPAPSVSPEGEVAKEDAAIESFYQLEKYAQRALGLDEATYEAGMRQKMQEEAMSEAFDPKDELSARVSRMLPNPRFYEGKWQGELQAIHDSMVKTDKNGKINKRKADNFFQTKANTGNDQDILELIEELNQEYGFDFEGEDDFFAALQQSVDYTTSDGTMGARQFPIGATHWTREREEWINGGMSFSIGETVVQPNGNTRILPTENGGLIGPAQIDLSFSITAYHGTRSNVDKFSADKIGEGTGAFVFGYGLYFTNKQALADEYRERLTNSEQGLLYKGKPIEESDFGMLFQFHFSEAFFSQNNDGLIYVLEEAVRNGKQELKEQTKRSLHPLLSDDEKNRINNRIEALEKGISDDQRDIKFLKDNPDFYKDITRSEAPVGNVYRVELNADVESNILDWTKVFGEQPKNVQEALKEVLSDYDEGLNIILDLVDDPEAYYMDHLYRKMASFIKDPLASNYENMYGKGVSDKLSKAGIKGIKYIERTFAGPATNYVIFDDADIEITAGIGQAFDEAKGEETRIAADGLIEVIKPNNATESGSIGQTFAADSLIDVSNIEGDDFDAPTFSIAPEIDQSAYPPMNEFLANQLLSETDTIGVCHIDRAGIGEIDGLPIQGGMYYPAIKENLEKEVVWAFNSPKTALSVIERAKKHNGYLALVLMAQGNVSGNKTYARLWLDRLEKVLKTKEQEQEFLKVFHTVREAAINGKIKLQRRSEKDRDARRKQKGLPPLGQLAEEEIAKEDREAAKIKTFKEAKKFLIAMGQTSRGSFYFTRTTQSEDTLTGAKKGDSVYGKLLGKKIGQKHGWPSAADLVEEMEAKDFAKMRIGDIVGFIKIDVDSPVLSARQAGVPEHLSYGYVVKGKPYARAKKIKNIDDDFPALKGRLQSQGNKAYKAADYATFSIIPKEEGGTLPPSTFSSLEPLGYKPEASEKTQITSTKATYKKIASSEVEEGMTVLDYASGLGAGTLEAKAIGEKKGFTVVGYEPFSNPERRQTTPEYEGEGANDLIPDGSVDVIINNAVLNVVPGNVGKAIVKDIYKKLRPGGSAFINVMGWNNIKGRLKSEGTKLVGPREVLTSKGTFQKGYTSQTLKEMIQRELPRAEIVSTKYGDVGVKVTKPLATNYTFSIAEVTDQDTAYLDALNRADFAKAEAMVTEAAKKKGGFKIFHGSWEHRKIAQADRFRPGGYASSRVVYFTDEENRQLSKDFGLVREYFYFPTKAIADIRSKSDTPELRKLIKQFNERGGYGVLDGSHRKKRYGKDFVRGYDPTWELLDDEDYVNAADFLFDGTYDAIQVDEDFAESNELGYDRDAIAIIDTNKIKSADLVTFDSNGKVIPLSKRFDMGVTNLSFSIVEKSQGQNTLRAVDRLFGNSKNALETGLKMKERLNKVRQRYEDLKYKRDWQGDDLTRDDQIINALMQINAIASVLPPEVRKRVGSPVPVVSRKTDKGIEKQVQEKLEKVSKALDAYLQKTLRKKIKDVLKKSDPKVQNGRRTGVIGAFGHDISAFIDGLYEKTLEEAEAQIQALSDKFEEIENPTLEDYEMWDAQTLAVDLFYDFDNATTARLEQAYDFVLLNYKEGRKEWLQTLKERKEKRKQFVDQFIEFNGGARTKQGDVEEAEQIAQKSKLGFLTQWLNSGHHVLAKTVENAKDKRKARAWFYIMLDQRIKNEVDTENESNQKKDALIAKIAEVIGAKGTTAGHEVRKFLAEATKVRPTSVTYVHGASKETISVRLDEAELILRGEKDSYKGEYFSSEDLYALEQAYEKALEKPEQVPSHIKFDRIIEGERIPIDETTGEERVGLSYANALQYWLTMRQEDQAQKLEAMGWDADTKAELEAFLPDELKEIGVWMSEQLVADGVSINDKHREEYGISLALHDFYWPVRNVVAGKEADIAVDGKGPNRGMSSGALKERVRNLAKPASVNAFSVYFQHTSEMAYWKNNISWFRQYGTAMRSNEFAETFKSAVGKKEYQELNAYLQSIETRGESMRVQMTDLEGIVKSMTSRFALGVLGARISTMWINATSFVNALASPDVSMTRIVRNAVGMMVDGNGALKATWRNELSELRRKYGASFEAQLAMQSGNKGPVLIQDAEKLAQLGMLPMNYIDVGAGSVTYAAIWKEYYDAGIKRGDSDQAARSEADKAVSRAQAMLAQPSIGVSRSLAEQRSGGNVFMALMTMFLSETRKNAANNYMAWRTLLTGKGIVDRPTAARQAFVYTIINTVVVQAFRSAYQFATGSDEEDEEYEEQLRDPRFWLYSIMTETGRAVPILSDAVLFLSAKPLGQKYWGSKNPFVGIANKLTQAGKVWDDDLTDSERLEALLDQMQAGGSLFPGGAIIAEAANVGEFVHEVYTNGLGKDFTEKDRIKRYAKEVMANKKDVYEKFEDSEDRIPLMIDVLEQYQTEFPEQFPLILDELKARDSETGEVKTLKSGATEYKLPQEIMKHFVD